MSSNAVIDLTGVSKCYRLYSRPQDRLKQMLFRGRRKYFNEFWALHDVSLRIEKGACVGVVGRNGAGKSTLLQIITGIVAPTEGQVAIKGRVAALLELGTGFNPDFTGRENVFLNGSILGLTQEEIRDRYGDIVNFADIGEFINQPVKTYSSGMLVRLAFAVAIHVDPEVLIVDEALSVGDAKFQSKCFRKFQEFREKQKTILFVSHATEQVIRHCDSAVLLEAGRILDIGEPRDVTNKYLSLLFDTNPIEKEAESKLAPQSEKNSDPASSNGSGADSAGELNKFLSNTSSDDFSVTRPGYNKAEFRCGSADAKIVDYLLSDDKHWHVNHFQSGDKITLWVKVKFLRDVARPIFGLTVKTPDGVTIFGTNSRDYDSAGTFVARKAGELVIVNFSLTARLTSGHYLISLGVVEEGTENVVPLDRRYDFFEIYITNERKVYGIADLDMTFSQSK